MEEDVDKIMLEEYDLLCDQVRDYRELTSLVKLEQEINQAQKRELEVLRRELDRIQVELQYYQDASTFQGP